MAPVPPHLPSHQIAADALLVVFLAAVLVMVGAVALVTIVDEWWVLVPVMLIDFVATACVLGALIHLMRSS